MKKFYMMCLAVLGFVVVRGQDSTEARNAKELGEVVVSTGQYKPQSVKNSVYQVKVIDKERIQLRAPANITQVLMTELGFRFVNDNTLGTTDVQLMGMSGRNVKILLDGVPMVDRGDTRESLNQIDVNTIERIEIVEGPMSVSYGSDALAGVINLITKKNAANTLSVNARIQEETAGTEYYPFSYKGVHQQSVNVDWRKKKWNLAAGGSHIDHDGFGGDDWGRLKEWKPKEQWMGHMKLGFTLNRFNIYYRLDGLDETISSRGRIGQAYTAFDQYYITSRFMHQLQNEWRISDKVQLNNIVSFTDYSRRTKSVRHDFTTGTEVLTTGAGEQDTAKFTNFIFRSTLQYRVSDMVSLQPGIEINREQAKGQRIAGRPVIADYAFFVSSEIKPTDKINIRPGLRFIKNSVYNAPPVIPSLNARFSLNNEWSVRLSYAYGFRSPALRELYFDFHDANHDIVGNPDLKAEHSNSINGSVNWTGKRGKVRIDSKIGGFYNVFDNLITYAQDPANPNQFKTFNVDKFKTTGILLENNFAWNNWQFMPGFAFIGRYNSLSDDETFKDEGLRTFNWSPEANMNIIYKWKKTGLTFALFYKYTGTRPGYQVVTNTSGAEEVQETKLDDFHWGDFTVSKSLFKFFTLTGGVKNVFDVNTISSTVTDTGGAHSSGGSQAISYGRSYFLGLNFNWTKK